MPILQVFYCQIFTTNLKLLIRSDLIWWVFGGGHRMTRPCEERSNLYIGQSTKPDAGVTGVRLTGNLNTPLC